MKQTGFSFNNICAALLAHAVALGVGAAVGVLVLNASSLPKLAAVILGLLAVWGTLAKPEWGLLTLVFLTYTRLSDILVHYHGAPSIAKPFIGLLVVLILFRWWWHGSRPDGWQRAAILAVGYGLAMAASFLVAEDFERAQSALSIYAKDVLLVLIIAVMLQQSISMRRTIWALLAAGMLMGTISLHQQLTGSFHHAYWGFGQAAVQHLAGETNDFRLAGPIGDPNFYAQILLVLIPIALDRLWREPTIWGRLAAAYTTFVCSWAFVFTFSRGGLVALAFALFVMAVRRPPKMVVLVPGLCLMLFLIPLIPADYTARITTIFDAASSLTDEGHTDAAVKGRLSENLVGLQIFVDHPILGVGLNNYPVHYRRYAQGIGLDLRHEDRSAHNLYLQIAAETGLVGLTMFGLLILTMFRGLRQTYVTLTHLGKTDEAEMVMTFGIALLGYLTAAVFLHSAYPRYFWLLFGIALAIYNVGKKAREHDDAHPEPPAYQVTRPDAAAAPVSL